jgi:hypothetical protein
MHFFRSSHGNFISFSGVFVIHNLLFYFTLGMKKCHSTKFTQSSGAESKVLASVPNTITITLLYKNPVYI